MKITGFWSMEFPVSRFGDLVAAVDKARELGVPWDADVELTWDTKIRQSVLILAPQDGVEGDLIECGNHVNERRWDVIFPVHKCPDGSDD